MISTTYLLFDRMVLVIPKSGLSPHMTIGQSALDSDTPDKFLEIPSYMPSFGEKD